MKSLVFKTSFSLFIVLVLLSCTKDENNTLFTLIPSSHTGIKFKNILKETKEFNVLEYGYLYNGGGISIGDLNNDGLSDIYFTGNMVGSRLYVNKGDFKFEEVAEKAGVFAAGLWNTGTTMADVNADGFLDIYVCRSAAKDPNKRKNLLFINNGDMTFSEKGAAYGIDDSGYSTQGNFFDYDNDGDLDLYVLNHSTQEYAGFGQITASLKNKKNEAYSDKLYKNENGKFIDVSEKAGLVSNVLGFGLGVALSDINNDGWSDIYVSNDYNEQDYLYINNQDGTFTESLEDFIGHSSLFSMGSDIADINNDGFTDIMTLDMLPEGNQRQKMVSGPDNYDKYQLLVNSGFYNQSMRNMLQLNNGGSSFSEIGQLAGVSNTDWSWSSLFADFDNDGHKDLFITNGYKRDFTNMDFINYAVQEKLKENQTGQKTAIMKLIQEIPSTVVENYMYRNKGDLSFEKTNAIWGFNRKSLSNGAAYADLDNDGDLDLVVNNIEEEAFVYRNNSETQVENNRYLKVKLEGSGQNRFGVGARVELKVNNTIQVQEMLPTRGYQSSVDFNLLFGLGSADQVDELKIIWPNSKMELLTDVPANQLIVVKQTNAKSSIGPQTQVQNTYFEDRSQDSLIPFVHQENVFIDFKREQLLPHKLSTQGPKIAKGDINNDGVEDLFICGAKGATGSLLVQNNLGKFNAYAQDTFENNRLSEDIDALFFDADGDKDLDLYVVSGGSDFSSDASELQDRLYFNNGQGKFSKKVEALPEMRMSGSCVTASDFDNDGDLDLFVGGRLVPGHYPNAPRSYVLKNDGKGRFTDFTAEVNQELLHPGMVTDAVWTDFDGDTNDDLILVGEWMEIRIFKNIVGTLTEVKTDSGLTNSQGWWNVITPGDFDNDGDTDYILGNFGLNSQLKASFDEPVELYVKDFDSNGSLDPIMCSYILGESYPVFSKDDLVGQLNGLKAKYTSYAEYSDQKITDIFTAKELSDATVLKANNFASSYMENLGNARFKLTPLPAPIQFSPIFGSISEDFNGDGNLDVVMGGNFFGTRVKYGRYDANKGNLLLGDGKGGFQPTGNTISGLKISGEIRDIEIITTKQNNQIILFAKNNEPVEVYNINPAKKN